MVQAWFKKSDFDPPKRHGMEPTVIRHRIHKRVGIWTLEDLEMKPNEAASALVGLFTLDLATLRKRARLLAEQEA